MLPAFLTPDSTVLALGIAKTCLRLSLGHEAEAVQLLQNKRLIQVNESFVLCPSDPK